jgi:hypothetical protein
MDVADTNIVSTFARVDANSLLLDLLKTFAFISRLPRTTNCEKQ